MILNNQNIYLTLLPFLFPYPLIISAKLYSCPRYGKNTKYTSRLTRHLNACKKEATYIASHQIQHKLHNKKDIPNWDFEDGS